MGHRSRGADGRARAVARFHGAEGGHASHARSGAHRHSHDRRRRRDADRRLSHMKRRGTHMGVRVTLGLVLVMTVLLVAGPALAQGKWSQLKPIPQGEEEVYGTAAGGKMYVLGGLGAFPSWEPKMMLWSFDPATSEWKRLASIPEGIHHPGFAAVGGKLYSIGGFPIARPAGGGLPAWGPPEFGGVYDTPANAGAEGPPLPTPPRAPSAPGGGAQN